MTRPVPDSRDDNALKQALLALPARHGTTPAGDVDALRSRVLAQWQARHAAGGGATGTPPAAARRPWRRRLWFGSAGLAAAAALATALFVQHADPALDDLMQPDVLSQIAIGEM